MPIDPALLNPNLLYIGLLLGLWFGVTAAYVPGTGFAEVIAFATLVGSFILLTMVATNWIAVALLVIGVSAFLLLPFFGQRFRNFAEAGLVLQAIGGFFLFEDMQVSPVLIAITVLIAVMYHRLVLLPIIRSQMEQNEFDDAGNLIGRHGRVVKDLDPVGTVYVNKELWRARSDDHLTKDTPVVVTDQEGLELRVEKAKRFDEREAMERLQLDEMPRQNGATSKK